MALLIFDEAFSVDSYSTDTIKRLVYWNSNQNLYYEVSTLIELDEVCYKFQQSEHDRHIYYPKRNQLVETKYLGAVSPTNLVYLNADRIIMFQLSPIDDSFVELYDDMTRKMVEIPNTNTFYPYTYSLYTNKEMSLYWWRNGQNKRLRPVD